MLLAIVLGVTLAVAGRELIDQWRGRVLAERRPTAALTAIEFPHLAPSTRPVRLEQRRALRTHGPAPRRLAA